VNTLGNVAESPDIRASDSDRERAADALRRHFGEGRLTLEELEDRLSEVYATRTLGQLTSSQGPMRELPVLAPPPPVQTTGHPDHTRHLSKGFPEHLAAYIAVNVMLIFIWIAAGGGFFWPIFPIAGWGIGVVAHYTGARQRPPLRPR
jgi:uncharacterized protein DUF1707/2TM domain-containing protein